MKPFNLSEYLENPSRKVVTRDGREAIIVCTNADDKFPVVAKIQGWDAPFVELFNRDGIHSLDWDECSFDLFFADEEEELTEFEKELQTIISNASHLTSDDGSISTYCQFGDKEIKKISGQILDLARKEILKDLPKWKKATEHKDLEKHIAILEDGKVLLSNYLEEGDYYVDLQDLKSLPKEE